MNPKGTVRKDSITHRVYEAVYTFPKDKFTANDIWESLKKDYPDVKLATVRTLLTSAKSYIPELIHKAGREGRANVFVKRKDPKVRPVYDPETDKKQVFEKPPPSSETSESVPTSSTVSTPSNEVTAEQIGEGMIALVTKLKSEISQLHIKISDMEIKLKNNDESWRKTLQEKDRTIASLNSRLTLLNRQVQTKSRTFPLSELMNGNGKS